MREPQTRQDEAERVIERFRHSDGFLSVSLPLVKHSPLGEGVCQEVTRQYGGKRRDSEPLTDPITLKRLH
jgi:hypothetical protein